MRKIIENIPAPWEPETPEKPKTAKKKKEAEENADPKPTEE